MVRERRIRVLLADDHAMVRQGLAQLLEDDKRIHVVGQADNGMEAVSLAKSLKPDVAVLDYSMPRTDGITAAEKILRCSPSTKILILSVHDNVHYVFRSMDAGARGFVVKTAAARELIKGIRAVHAGEIYFSRVISEKMTGHLSGDKFRISLSGREFEFLRLLGAGHGLHECAQFMRISESAASTYRARLLKKLKLSNTAHLIRFALENGIIG